MLAIKRDWRIFFGKTGIQRDAIFTHFQVAFCEAFFEE